MSRDGGDIDLIEGGDVELVLQYKMLSTIIWPLTDIVTTEIVTTVI